MSGSHQAACLKYVCIGIFNYASVFNTGTSQQEKGFSSWEALAFLGCPEMPQLDSLAPLKQRMPQQGVQILPCGF